MSLKERVNAPLFKPSEDTLDDAFVSLDEVALALAMRQKACVVEFSSLVKQLKAYYKQPVDLQYIAKTWEQHGITVTSSIYLGQPYEFRW